MAHFEKTDIDENKYITTTIFWTYELSKSD